jgi:DNA-binding PadR family transcriptional regulator
LSTRGWFPSIQVLVSGRTRRVFEITPAGRTQLAANWAVWEEFTGVVRGIVHHHQEGERQEPADPAQSRA